LTTAVGPTLQKKALTGTGAWGSNVSNIPSGTPARWIWWSVTSGSQDVYFRYTITDLVTPVEGTAAIIKGPELACTPNPFSGHAIITFEVPSRQNVSVRIYDASGRLIRTLQDGQITAGRHTVSFNSTRDNGRALANGTYFCRMQAKGFEKTVKLMLVR